MNTRNRLLVLVAGIVLLAGCQSLEIPTEEAESELKSEPAAVERTIRVAMTMPRPRPPQAEPLALGRKLPEPGIPALPESLSLSQPNPDRQIPDGPADPLLRPAEPETPPRSATAPYFPDRGLDFRLSHPSRHAPVLALEPSSRALAGAEEPPPPAEVAPAAARPTADAAAATPAAGESEVKAARAPTADASTRVAQTAAAPTRVAPTADASARVAPTTAASTAGTPAAARATPAPEWPASTTNAWTAQQQTAPEREERKLVARRGDPIAVDLEGSGWIYTGLRAAGAPDSGEQQGIDFLSRRNYQNRTSFNFKAVDYGDYELNFQYQDHQQAVLRSQVVHLRVVPEQDFAAALEQQQPALSIQAEPTAVGFEPLPGPPIRRADTLFDLGEYELALIEYKRNMRSGDPYLNDRLAECYARTGEHLAAVKYYRENLGLEGEYGDRAAVGLVRSSIALEDSRLLLEVLPSLFSLESVQIGGELLEIARFQTEDRRFSVALQALQQYVSRYPDGRNLDEVYYRLARIYEVDSPYRDLESALHYYSLLYELFPESLYADPAAERLNYLNRHFFLVQ